ncbi:MAG: four helix bundle protein [bacterium]
MWKRAVAFTDEILLIANSLPKEEQYSLGEQIRRASLSIPTNIAEGSGRMSKKEFYHFLNITRGSIYEVANLLIICHRRGYIDDDKKERNLKEIEEISRMISSLMQRLKSMEQGARSMEYSTLTLRSVFRAPCLLFASRFMLLAPSSSSSLHAPRSLLHAPRSKLHAPRSKLHAP